MLVFVDESGDPGLDIAQGSSEYFVVALVIFKDNDEAEATDKRIDLLKTELSLPQNHEFHFHDNHPNIRKAFLNAVGGFNFFYFGIVINKRKLYGEGFKFSDSFYKYASGLVFENAKGHLYNAIVVFDKCGDKTFRGQLSKYLSSKTNGKGCNFLIKKIKTQSSHNNNLIQLADMVCGSIYRFYNSNKRDRNEYRKIISHREIFVQFWPK